MHSLSYHAYDDYYNSSLNKCSRESFDRPLIVNCAGTTLTISNFKTDNVDGRLDYYLLYIVRGELDLVMPEGTETMTPGAFVFFPPRFRYQYSHKQDDTIEYMWLHFTGSDVLQSLEKYGLKMYPQINKIESDDNIIARFQNIFNTFTKHDAFRDNELSVLLDRLFISLARRLNGGGASDHLLKRSLLYINNSYNKNLSIPELAAIEGLSVSRYNTVFKRVTGVSPIQYITSMRISSACDLLASTDLPIKQIAIMVGYPDSHFFSRIFHAKTGTSPAMFRKNR